MNRDLDEIEAELGKERTLKVGDRVRTYYTRKEGVIVGPCPRHSGNWHVDVGDGTCNVKCAAECNLTPVEPERVWNYKEGCAWSGRCEIHPCTSACPYWPKPPSPGLLQRMGMCVWACDAKDWCVFFQPALMTEAEAHDFASRYKSAKVFRWQDGVQG